jgi:hypothetical protein
VTRTAVPYHRRGSLLDTDNWDPIREPFRVGSGVRVRLRCVDVAGYLGVSHQRVCADARRGETAGASARSPWFVVDRGRDRAVG